MSDESLDVGAMIVGHSENKTFQVDTITDGKIKVDWTDGIDCYTPKITFDGPEFSVSILFESTDVTPEELADMIKEEAKVVPEEERC